ncbi:MAG: DUF86 domain-containing protein [Anaerolineae bacterium]|jgi:uncharacterized protein with HEPN domain|nr:DUF86 domain-containing protein [Anaerolineae bacterium]
MNERDELRLRHMRDAAQNALKFSQGRTEQALKDDLLFAYALAHALQIIGEAAAQITRETRGQYPQIPWDAMIGMRQWLVHGYDRIKHDLIWSTVHKDLVPLIEKLDAILPPLPPENPA